MFGYSVKVFSYPDWKLPGHPETRQVSVCLSVNKQCVLGLETHPVVMVGLAHLCV